MSTLRMEFMEMIEGLSDDTMRILLEVVKQVVFSLDHKEKVSALHLNIRANRVEWAV